MERNGKCIMDEVLNLDLYEVRNLVNEGYDVDYTEPDGWSLLDQAELDYSTDIVKYLKRKIKAG